MSDHAIDRDQTLPLDARMDDIRAVMDAAGSQRGVWRVYAPGPK
jgi:hypothetical protein